MTSERNAHGQFVKGQSGNPTGKPIGAKSPTASLRKLLEEMGADGKTKADKIAEKLVELALGGDVPAIKVVLDRIDGAVLQKVAPVTPDGEHEYGALTDTERAHRLLAAVQRLGESRAGRSAAVAGAGGNMDPAAGTADGGGGK